MTQISQRSRTIFVLLAVLSLAFAVSVFQVSAESIGTTSAISFDGHCEIPDSGPWPPCATGGDSSSGGDCVIPASGPWPACATGGGSGGGGAASAPGQACPSSGKWPAGCVPGGGGGAAPAPGGSGGDCVIPDSGPWPPCATGGGGGGTAPAAPAPAPTAPAPAPTPAPEPEPELATEEPIGLITLVYGSDPDEVLGVFPVFEFNADTLFVRMLFNQATLEIMRQNLDGAKSGDQASCDRYEDAYELMKASGGFYVNVPGNWQNIHDSYLLAFIYSLDRTRPAYLSCLNSGAVSDFNYGLAYTAIETARNVLNPAVEQAAANLAQ